MKIFSLILVLMLSFAGIAHSYPESKMDDCIRSALSNPATKTISEIAITNYCDCFLTSTIDKKKNIRESGYECAQNNLRQNQE